MTRFPTQHPFICCRFKLAGGEHGKKEDKMGAGHWDKDGQEPKWGQGDEPEG